MQNCSVIAIKSDKPLTLGARMLIASVFLVLNTKTCTYTHRQNVTCYMQHAIQTRRLQIKTQSAKFEAVSAEWKPLYAALA